MTITHNLLISFIIGGLICAVIQVIIDKTSLTPARILSGLVVIGVILGAIGLYEPFVQFAGAGATVPLSGFGYLLFKGVKSAVDSSGLFGALTGGLTASAAGITAAVFFGFLVSLVSRSHEKK